MLTRFVAVCNVTHGVVVLSSVNGEFSSGEVVRGLYQH